MGKKSNVCFSFQWKKFEAIFLRVMFLEILLFAGILSSTANTNSRETKNCDLSENHSTRNNSESPLAQQNRTIGGSVKDATGQPLPGVTIKVKGTTIGIISDSNGQFKISIPANAEILSFSFIGMKSQELSITGKSTFNIVMYEETVGLDDIVIIGYGQVKKADLTGSVQSIKGAEISVEKTGNFLEAMNGKIAGVQISSQSGELGSGVDINIRGSNSINAGTQPLYVIDGVQMDANKNEIAMVSSQGGFGMNPMTGLNPNDIASIEVLKDASATAIYGSRGANGVVIITTKTGQAGRVKISLDVSLGASQAGKLYDVLDADTYEMYQMDDGNNARKTGGYLFGAGYVDWNNRYLQTRNWPSELKHDWQNEIYRTGYYQDYNASLSGGTKELTFSGGLGFNKILGLVNDNSQNRISARSKITGKRDKLGYGINMNYSNVKNDGVVGVGGPGGYGTITSFSVTERPIEILRPTETVFDLTPPTSLIKNGINNVRTERFLGDIYFDYDFNKGFNLRVSAGITSSNSKGNSFYGIDTPWGRTNQGQAALYNNISYSWFERNVLTYQKDFDKNNSLNVMVAAELNSYELSSMKATNMNFGGDESTTYFDISKGVNLQIPTSGYEKNQLESFLGRINYNFMKRYLFTVSFRADGSSKFGTNNRMAYFPSGAFAWKMSEEKFLKKVNWMNNLKLRFSYGVTGNDRIPAYSVTGKLTSSKYPSNDVQMVGMAPTSLSNTDLKWETTSQYNIGLDLGVLKNKINLTADVYKKYTFDMLMNTPIPNQTGFSTQYRNIGNMENKGVELSLNGIILEKGAFKWTTTINLSANINQVTDLGKTEFIPISVGGGWHADAGRIIKGQPLGIMYGMEKIGIYQLTDFTWQNSSDPTIDFRDRIFTPKPDVQTIKGITNLLPGDIKFLDVNGDGIVDPAVDRKVIGDSNPKHYGGMNNTFTYTKSELGSFDLSVFVNWNYGNQIYNSGKYTTSGAGNSGTYNITKEFWNNRWTETNPTNEYFARWNRTRDIVSSYFVEDGSFLRLSNITLAYTFPERLLSKMRISNLRLNITGQNLAIWTNYTGYDPEVSSNVSALKGYDRVTYPRSTSLFLGLSATF